MFTPSIGFAVTGVKGSALKAALVLGLSVSWPETAGALSYRLRYRPKGGVWTTVTVKRPPKVLCPLTAGVWQLGFATVTEHGRGQWSPTVEVSV